MKVSTGFAEGCMGGIFLKQIPLLDANWSIAFELNGGPLSLSCEFGLPYVSYMSPFTGMTLSAFVEVTIFAAGNRDDMSCTTTTCFEFGIGPNRSTATSDQHFSGTLWGMMGSCVFLSVNS